MNRCALHLLLYVIVLGALCPALLITHSSCTWAAETTMPVAGKTAPDPALVARGHYIARVSDCSACHSPPNRPPYSGGMAFELPTGTLYSTNITPDSRYGIGAYSEADFARAVREGVRKDGKSLYPAMPFPSYARISDEDIHALYVYFHNYVAPQAIPSPSNRIHWPLTVRWPLIIWRWLFAPSVKAAQDKTAQQFSDPVLARGAYLVEGPGHCGACHTPRSLTMNEKALTSSDGLNYLAGGQVLDGWFVPSLRQENRTGLGRWTEQDIVNFLKKGRAIPGTAFGGMTSVVIHSSYDFTDADLHAIARYLLTLTPADSHQKPWVESFETRDMLQRADVSARGAQIYIDRCAACHRTDGHGYGTVFPPLAGNPAVMSDDPTSVVHIVQAGATLAGLPSAPSTFTMPGFADQLSDREIADVVSFIRQAWGNNAYPVKESEVAALRKTMPKSEPMFQRFHHRHFSKRHLRRLLLPH